MKEGNEAHGKVAIVTGAGTGIGRAAALALLEDGWRVALAGRRPDPLEELASQAGPDRALAVPTDVSDPKQVARLFGGARDSFGRVDLLFNNAGMGTPPIPLEDLSPEQWRSASERLSGPMIR